MVVQNEKNVNFIGAKNVAKLAFLMKNFGIFGITRKCLYFKCFIILII